MKILKIVLRVFCISLMVLVGFTAIMPNWFRDIDKIHDQLLHRFLSGEELVLRKRAEREGIPYKQYKKKLEADKARRELLAAENAKLNVELDAAIANGDLETVFIASNKLPIGEIGPDRILLSIKNGNVLIFKALYRNSVLCNSAPSYPVDPGLFEKDVYDAVIRAQNLEIFHAWYEMECHIGPYEYRQGPREDLVADLIKLNKASNIFVLAELDDYFKLVNEVIWQSLEKNQDAKAKAIFEQAFSTLDKKNLEVTFLARKDYDKPHYLYGRLGFKTSDDLFIYALQHRHLLFAKSVLEHDPNYIRRNSLMYHARDEVCYTNFAETHDVKDFYKNSHALFSDYPPLCVRELGGFRKIRLKN